MAWQPEIYGRFTPERGQPVEDLLARLPSGFEPRSIVDLGCGAGASTARLARRFPEARIEGVDDSASMLARARADLPDLVFRNADIASWLPDAGVDLVFSNAAFHWLADRNRVLAEVFEALAPGAVLAVQFPRMADAPSHRLLLDLIESRTWPAALRSAVPWASVAPVEAYARLLAPRAAAISAWETTYVHDLAGDGGVHAWVSGSILGQAMARLPEADAAALDAAYRERVARVYPPDAGGRVVYRFTRLFLVALRA